MTMTTLLNPHLPRNDPFLIVFYDRGKIVDRAAGPFEILHRQVQAAALEVVLHVAQDVREL